METPSTAAAAVDNSQKKRKLDRTQEDLQETRSLASRYLLPMDHDQMLNLMLDIASQIPEALEMIEERAQQDPVHRKLFIRGLNWETKKDKLESVFSEYGIVEDCAIVMDRSTGKSKGYGFVVFKDMDAAYAALDEPTKDIDGRQVKCNLAAIRNGGDNDDTQTATNPPQQLNTPSHPPNQDARKIFIKGLNYDTGKESLVSRFSEYGNVEDCWVLCDRETGKSRGMATVLFRNAADATAAVQRAPREIDGRAVTVQFSKTHSTQYPLQPQRSGSASNYGQRDSRDSFRDGYGHSGAPLGRGGGFIPQVGMGFMGAQGMGLYGFPGNPSYGGGF